MILAKDLQDIMDSELDASKMAAKYLALVKTADPAFRQAAAGARPDDSGKRIETLENAIIEYLRPGEGVSFADPKASGGYADFQRFTLRAIASGLGIPYELLTNDLSQVNYSSYRAGLVSFRRRVQQDQYLLIIVVLPLFL